MEKEDIDCAFEVYEQYFLGWVIYLEWAFGSCGFYDVGSV